MYILFSDPELGQVVPSNDGNFYLVIALLLGLYALVIIIDVAFETHKRKRRGRG